jgi:hypothetical protein
MANIGHLGGKQEPNLDPLITDDDRTAARFEWK